MQLPRPTPILEDLRAALSPDFVSIGLLKTGGQALLYKGRRIRTEKGIATDQAVAIKVYLDPNEDARIEKEVQAAREAKCDSLVKFLLSGRVSIGSTQYRFVVWEYVEGVDLEVRLQQGPCHAPLVALIGRDVTVAIEALWAQRVVHRDVNPKNIMIRRGEESAVLIDLGIAKYVEQTALTAPGLTWGTQGYLSPEQLAGANLTWHSDVFSLGITLQQALLGIHPTRGNQAQILYGLRATGLICPHAPAGLALLIDRMLHLRPARRPQLAELAAGFQNLLRGV